MVFAPCKMRLESPAFQQLDRIPAKHTGEGAGQDGLVVVHGVVSSLVSSSSASTLPAATLPLSVVCRAVTVPSARALSHISIFMASTQTSG